MLRVNIAALRIHPMIMIAALIPALQLVETAMDTSFPSERPSETTGSALSRLLLALEQWPHHL